MSAERLAEFILGTFAFTTPVPYQVDVGHDFHCVLQRPAQDRRMLRAGPAFSVQVKSTPEPVSYEAGAPAEWLSDQVNPFFLCVVDRPKLSLALYSTWNTHNAHLLHGPKRTVLQPDTPIEEFRQPALVGDTLYVPLGPPLLRLTPDQVVEPSEAMRCADILEPWIQLDRDNIANRRTEMYWILGPNRWVTNEPFQGDIKWLGAFYHNPKNLDRCVGNLLRSAVAVRRIMDQFRLHGVDMDRASEDAALDRLLQAFDKHLDPLTRHVLQERSSEQPLG